MAKIHPFIKEIECRQEVTLTPTRTLKPTGSELKTIHVCPPQHPHPIPHGGEHNSAIFDLQVTQMLLTKFHVNWIFGSGEEVQNRFLR